MNPFVKFFLLGLVVAGMMQAKIEAMIVGGMVTGGASTSRGGVFEKLFAPLPNPHGAPNSVGRNTFDDANLYGFDEGQNIVLSATTLSLDIVPDGKSKKILPGQIVSSHFVFFDPLSGNARGYVDFDAEILGIITDLSKQTATDPLVRTDIHYLSPTARGLEREDSATFDPINPRRLWLQLSANDPGDYIRVITGPSVKGADPTKVPASAAIELAGFPVGTISTLGNVAPTNSPAEVFSIPVKTGSFLTFEATGKVDLPDFFGGGSVDPTGLASTFVAIPSQGLKSISGTVCPVGSLVGVFLGHVVPTAGPTPVSLDFSTQKLGSAQNLAPLLKQVFRIGSGRTTNGEPLRVYVPAEATRLFLGVMSPTNHVGFTGEFDVTVARNRNSLLSARWENRNKIEFCWEPIYGGLLQIESAEDPFTGPWSPVGPVVVGDGQTRCLTIDRVPKEKLFYRLSLQF